MRRAGILVALNDGIADGEVDTTDAGAQNGLDGALHKAQGNRPAGKPVHK